MSHALRTYVLMNERISVLNLIRKNKLLKISQNEVEFMNKEKNFEMMKVLIENKVLLEYRLKN